MNPTERAAFIDALSAKGGAFAEAIAEQDRTERRRESRQPGSRTADSALDVAEETIKRGIRNGTLEAKLVRSMGGAREAANAVIQKAARIAAASDAPDGFEREDELDENGNVAVRRLRAVRR